MRSPIFHIIAGIRVGVVVSVETYKVANKIDQTMAKTTFQICIWSLIALIANGFSIDEQLQRLTEKYEYLLERDVQMEEKINKLEAKVQLQELLIAELQNQRKGDQPTDVISQSKAAIFRTCHETKLADPSITSGWYWIDPDGLGVGDDPIYVYCDAATGSTSVQHDSESKINVGHCDDPGCYSRSIKYSATSKQLSALNQLSTECHQSIQYDCNYAPFEFGGIQFSWWNDKTGTPQYFWAGRNESVHTCQCGIDHNCVESIKTCNCDSVAPLPLNDTGIISNKNYLPITRLNFGRTQISTSSGEHTLGRFSCRGRTTISGKPKSCTDLWLIGHTLSGFYSVAGTKQVQSVYCDFTKLPDDSGFQTFIGYEDVQSSPTYFYVAVPPSLTAKGIISYLTEFLNIGNGMNKTSGIFTAPKAGRYFFSFTGVVDSHPSAGSFDLYIWMYVNGRTYGYTYANSKSDDYETISIVSTLDLKERDQVWLDITSLSNARLYNDAHFTGWLLQEDLVF